MVDSVVRMQPDGPDGIGLTFMGNCDSEDVIAGEPVEIGHNYFEDRTQQLNAGVWECTAYTLARVVVSRIRTGNVGRSWGPGPGDAELHRRGSGPRGCRRRRVDECGWHAAVCTSPDGLTWSRVLDGLHRLPDNRKRCLSPGPDSRMLGVTVGPSGLVAVGEEHWVLAAAVLNG